MCTAALVSPWSQGVLPSARGLDAHALLAQLAHGLFAVGAIEPIQHQHAVEVIDLVQEHASEELVAPDDNFIAVEVEALHGDDFGPHDLERETGQRETAFFVRPLA